MYKLHQCTLKIQFCKAFEGGIKMFFSSFRACRGIYEIPRLTLGMTKGGSVYF